MNAKLIPLPTNLSITVNPHRQTKELEIVLCHGKQQLCINEGFGHMKQARLD